MYNEKHFTNIWDVEHVPISELPRISSFFIAKHSIPREDIIGDICNWGLICSLYFC